MNFKVEHAIIVILSIAIGYFVLTHSSGGALRDHPLVKGVAAEHMFGCTGCGKHGYIAPSGTSCHCGQGVCSGTGNSTFDCLK